jgi:hypothetical protein
MATVDLVVSDLDGTLWFGEYEAETGERIASGGHPPARGHEHRDATQLALVPGRDMIGIRLLLDFV